MTSDDLLDVASLLDEEERDIQQAVRAFLADKAMPFAGRWFAEGRFPVELIPEFGRMGLLGMSLTGYGCAGTGAVAYGLACLELEAVDSGLRSFVSVQGSLAMYALWRYGSEEQKEAWLPRMATGDAVGCFGLTEPDQGSDPGGMRTTARRTSSGTWVLDGTKLWITNGSIADVAVVWARTEDGVRGFLVPRDTPGFVARDLEGKLSMRASVTSELSLAGCELPADAMLPEARGLRAPLSCLTQARYGIAWGALGAARNCLETALDYAGTREQFGRPIAAYQLTQRKLVEMAVGYERGLLLALHLGRLKEAGRLRPEQVSLGKLANVRTALDIAREARTVLGANGIAVDYPPMRHAANLETVLTYEGTEEIHTLVLGEKLTGHAAFR
ncbi:MAG TPA: acyl-CoA dehydrogenase family protein [Actinopolymorphaceae bacterium]